MFLRQGKPLVAGASRLLVLNRAFSMPVEGCQASDSGYRLVVLPVDKGPFPRNKRFSRLRGPFYVLGNSGECAAGFDG